jgi:hypothetical protein
MTASSGFSAATGGIHGKLHAAFNSLVADAERIFTNRTLKEEVREKSVSSDAGRRFDGMSVSHQ